MPATARGRRGRRGRDGQPELAGPALLIYDKLRGGLLGLLAGEALGLVATGRTRDDILRQEGRITRLPDPPSAGPLARMLLVLDGALAEPLPASPERPAEALVAAGLRAVLRPGDVPAPDGPLAEPAAWLGVAATVAFASDPLQRPRASRLLTALATAARSPAGTAAVETLRRQALSPPGPGAAEAELGPLPGELPAVALAVQAVLLRPDSVEAAVLHAVNQGDPIGAPGAVALRAALAGLLAGLHRGGAAVPERWTLPLPEAAGLSGLARRLLPALARTETGTAGETGEARTAYLQASPDGGVRS